MYIGGKASAQVSREVQASYTPRPELRDPGIRREVPAVSRLINEGVRVPQQHELEPEPAGAALEARVQALEQQVASLSQQLLSVQQQHAALLQRLGLWGAQP